MKRILLLFLLIAGSYFVKAQQQIISGEYWFDNAFSNKIPIPVAPSTNYTFNSGIQCSSLSIGIHTLNMRFRQTNGRWSSVTSQLFLKVPPDNPGDNKIISYEYWVDNSYASKVSQVVSPSTTFNFVSGINYNSLSTGIHVFNMRFRQSNGRWSDLTSQMFLKVPPDNSGDNRVISYEYWVDNSYATKVSQAVSPSVTFNFISGINYSSLSSGIHVFNIRFRQSDGRWSSATSQLFLKSPLDIAGDNKIISYEYWVDNSYSSRTNQSATPSATVTIASALNYSSLSNGIHSFNIRFRQIDGRWSVTQTQMFLKLQALAGTNNITSYEYWFNADFAGRTKLNTPTAPIYTTASILNIDTMSQFLNVFHARFSDSKGAWTYVEQYFYSLHLDLSIYLQGLYESGTGFMRKAQNATGNNFTGTIADTLSVQIREGIAPYNVLLNFSGLELQTDGACQVLGHGSNLVNTPQLSNTTYFIVIKHRNSIETWSQAIPLSRQSAYNFTDAASKAYGNNLLMSGSAYLIYGGDINQDGLIDSDDMIPVDNQASAFSTGYIPADANGDGLIDSGDMIIVDNNASVFISSITP